MRKGMVRGRVRATLTRHEVQSINIALHHSFFLGLDLSLRTFSDKLNLALSALPSASALTDTVLLKCSAFNAKGVSNSCILGLKSFSCSKQRLKQGL